MSALEVVDRGIRALRNQMCGEGELSGELEDARVAIALQMELHRRLLFSFKHGNGAATWSEIVARGEAALAACGGINTPVVDIHAELIEALDNTAASLETMLAHFGAKCPPDDTAARERVLVGARTALALARHGGPA